MGFHVFLVHAATKYHVFFYNLSRLPQGFWKQELKYKPVNGTMLPDLLYDYADRQCRFFLEMVNFFCGQPTKDCSLKIFLNICFIFDIVYNKFVAFVPVVVDR